MFKVVKTIDFGCLYEIVNKSNRKRYIGITFQEPNKRWIGHKTKARTRSKGHLYYSMNKYGIDNFEFNILDDKVPEELLYKLEIFWIKELKLQNPKYGYNSADGGKINKGYTIPKEVIERRKIRMLGDGNHFYGKSHSEETKKKISIKNKGKKHTEEFKLMQKEIQKGENSAWYGVTGESHPVYGRKRTEKEVQKIKENMPHSKCVEMLDKETEKSLIKFNSLNEASRWVKENTKYDKNVERSMASIIKLVCENARKTAYGYKWAYIDKIN